MLRACAGREWLRPEARQPWARGDCVFGEQGRARPRVARRALAPRNRRRLLALVPRDSQAIAGAAASSEATERPSILAKCRENSRCAPFPPCWLLHFDRVSEARVLDQLRPPAATTRGNGAPMSMDKRSVTGHREPDSSNSFASSSAPCSGDALSYRSLAQRIEAVRCRGTSRAQRQWSISFV